MMTAIKEISNTDDVIDVREIIERVEYLESRLDDTTGEYVCEDCGQAEASEDDYANHLCDDEAVELKQLRELLDELCGNGGDHDWRDGWYPGTLVRDSYFKDFAQQEAEDLDLVPTDHRWPTYCIDWDWAARELQQDYSQVEFDGVTYWYR